MPSTVEANCAPITLGSSSNSLSSTYNLKPNAIRVEQGFVLLILVLPKRWVTNFACDKCKPWFVLCPSSPKT